MRSALRVIAVASFVVAMLTSGSAVGQTPQQINWCSNRGGASVDQKISGCTAMIQSRRYKGKELGHVFHNRGVYQQERGDLGRAIADFDQAIRLDPEFAPSFYSRGLAYKDKGKLEDAFVDFDQAFRLDPNDTYARKNRALIYDSDENLDRALARFDEMIKQQGPIAFSVSPYFERGLVHYARREYDDAIADFDNVIGWAPKYGPALWNRARAYCAKGDYGSWSTDLGSAIMSDQKYVADHPTIDKCSF